MSTTFGRQFVFTPPADRAAYHNPRYKGYRRVQGLNTTRKVINNVKVIAAARGLTSNRAIAEDIGIAENVIYELFTNETLTSLTLNYIQGWAMKVQEVAVQ